jgi:hypothetical protein
MKFYEKAEEAAKQIVEAFQSPNRLPEPLAQVFVHRNDGSPCRSWSWRNQFIVAIHGHSEARGFRQWEQVGRRVQKGEKAFYILSPVTKLVVDEDTGEKKRLFYGVRGTPVFGYDQTEGDPLPKIDSQDWLRTLPLREVADEWGLSVESYNGSGGLRLGAYSKEGIALGVHNLSTWAHELVHAADDRNGSAAGSPKWKREVVAELGGATLLCLLGQDHDADLGGCWEYVQRYATPHGGDLTEICGTLIERTCEAVALILDTAERIRADSLSQLA